jgi:hypothetical protein
LRIIKQRYVCSLTHTPPPLIPSLYSKRLTTHLREKCLNLIRYQYKHKTNKQYQVHLIKQALSICCPRSETRHPQTPHPYPPLPSPSPSAKKLFYFVCRIIKTDFIEKQTHIEKILVGSRKKCTLKI